MTVKQLIARLKKESPNSVVVISSDSEGNSYSVVNSVNGNNRYKDGEIGLAKLTKKLKEEGYSEEDVMSDGKKCVVIWS